MKHTLKAIALTKQQEENQMSFHSLHPGDTLQLGHYPQTASGTDHTPIDWLVLDVRDGKALLISRYGLDAKPYNTEFTDVTWSDCTLRAWLNSTFLNTAFSSRERAAILTTDVDNSRDQHYSGFSTCASYPDTQDRIFLLSYAEANKYFGVTPENEGNIPARAEPTAYAAAQGVQVFRQHPAGSGSTAVWWWLRSPGFGNNWVSLVTNSGSLFPSIPVGNMAADRPAFWLTAEKLPQRF